MKSGQLCLFIEWLIDISVCHLCIIIFIAYTCDTQGTCSTRPARHRASGDFHRTTTVPASNQAEDYSLTGRTRLKKKITCKKNKPTQNTKASMITAWGDPGQPQATDEHRTCKR